MSSRLAVVQYDSALDPDNKGTVYDMTVFNRIYPVSRVTTSLGTIDWMSTSGLLLAAGIRSSKCVRIWLRSFGCNVIHLKEIES